MVVFALSKEKAMKLAAAVLVVVCLHMLFAWLRRRNIAETMHALACFPKTETEGRCVDDSDREARIRFERDDYNYGCWFAQLGLTAIAVILVLANVS